MPDRMELYTLAGDVPELSGPVLLYHLSGFMDAGAAGRLLTEHLLTTLCPRTIATFDADALIDYRSRRPTMIFDTDRWVEYETPELAVRVCEDVVGVPFLVMSGPEPDLAWERFAASVISFADRLGVGLTVGVNGIPMAVPHTRETGITPHGNRPDLFGDRPSWISRAEVPGNAGALIEYRMAEANRDAIGFAAHVPHYLAQAEYPAAAVALLNAITAATGLAFRTEKLEEAAEQARKRIDAQVTGSAEISEAIHNLEAQFDAVAAASENAPLADSATHVPDAEEIAAEFERFLAEQDE